MSLTVFKIPSFYYVSLETKETALNVVILEESSATPVTDLETNLVFHVTHQGN